MNNPIWILKGFHVQDRQDLQKLSFDTFFRLRVTKAQCIIETEKISEAGILLNYDDDHYKQGYGQFEEVFRALTKESYVSTIYIRP